MLKNLNLALRFLLELGSLISVGRWGYIHGSGKFHKIIFMILPMLVVALVWGVFGSPKAPFRLSTMMRTALLFVIYLLATLALIDTGKTTMAIIFTVAIIVNSVLMGIWKQ